MLPPDASFVVEARQRRQTWRQAGAVRTNAFRKNLVRGLQSFATGFPLDLSPAQIGAAVVPGAPPRTGLDRAQRLPASPTRSSSSWASPSRGSCSISPGNGSTWRALADSTNVAGRPILGATSLILVRRINPDSVVPHPVARSPPSPDYS